jgi:hypothetical protein
LNFLRIACGACLSLLCGFILYGCGTDGDGAPSLGEVKKFDVYRVYYAGAEVAGLPLEDIEGEDWQEDGRSIGWNFYYGDCDPPSGLFAEGGCQPPLQIQNYSSCRRWASLFSSKSDMFDFRGAKAARERGRGFEVFTGRTTVVIYGTRGRFVKSAARQLRDVRQTDRPSLLPPPAPGTLWGKRPCQDKPG